MTPQNLLSPPAHGEDRTLPVPAAILPSQSANQGPCLACGKLECHLMSHRHFSKHVLSNAKRKKLQTGTAGDRTPRQTTAAPVSASSNPVNTAQPPLRLDAERDHLLGLWSRSWCPTTNARSHALESHLFPTPFIDRVLPAARAHPPLLQALLAYSGTLYAIANNVISDMASRQQSFAVELLSQACPTEQEASTDEAMLAATLLLLVYMAQGNGFEVQKHVAGLVHLATLRGGLHYLGLGGLVSEVLTHADAMQAIFFNTEPVWTVPLPPLDIGPPARMGAGFRGMTSLSQEIDLPLVIAARSVSLVADVFNRAVEHPGEPLPKELSYLSMIALYQLARCNAAYHHTGTSNECVCLALILLNHVVLRNDGTVTPAILQVEYRFWQALERAENTGLMGGIGPRLYIWMCLMGVTISILLADGGRSQFWRVAVEKLRRRRIKAGVVGWESVRRDILEEFCWVSVVQEEVFKMMWIEVEGLNNVGMHTNGDTHAPMRNLNVLPPGG